MDKHMRYLLLCLMAYIVSGMVLNASSSDEVVLLNTGRMYIAPQENSGVSLYIQDAMRVSDTAQVVLNGTTELGGDFYQDSETNVFVTDESTGITTSTGTLSFVSDRGVVRQITTLSEDISTFDRGRYYIAFPAVNINTNDTISIPPKMGIDASAVKQESGKTGFLLLQSNVVGTDVYDASLRIPTQNSSSSALADAGAVVIEREMKAYRTGTQLFAFATPFYNTQLSGYFAGNWIRKPQAGANGSVTYVLGNKPKSSGSSEIHLDQYVTNAQTTLIPGQAYLIKPRPSGFDYDELKAAGGLAVTGASASAYDLDKFVFNGQVYTLPAYQEQLFAEDVLFSHTFASATNVTSTINWVIGNSYTSPISTQLLAEKMTNSGIAFSPVIYVFPAGSTSYQPLTITDTEGSIVVSDIQEIPAMSVFMIRVSKTQPGTLPAGTTFTLGKELQVHGNVAHNIGQPYAGAKAKSTVYDQLLLRVTPQNNEHIYDLAAIGIRDDAVESGGDKYDISKIYTAAKEGFQLFTLSSTGSKLSANGIPPTLDSVIIGFKPTLSETKYKLTASYIETLPTEGAWLEDLSTNTIIDLSVQQEYQFEILDNDPLERFIVHFKNKAKEEDNDDDDDEIPTGNPNTTYKDPVIYFADHQIVIKNLNSRDIHSSIYIHDLLGKVVGIYPVNNYPSMVIPAHFADGTYIVSLKGNRNISLKLIKQ